MTHKKMKILFMGTVQFSFTALSSLIKNKFKINGVITKRESNYNADYYDLTPLCADNNIPLFYKTKSNSNELVSFIKNINPDVIYCFGWSHILSNTVLTLPKYGVIGFHPAKLPSNRGRHPIIWALFLGIDETASTFFFMDEGADTGDIISQVKIKINNDNASSLYKKITKVALEQILLFSEDLEINKGVINRTKQDLTIGNSWRKRNINDGKIDFRMSTNAIINLVKALTHPYIGAHVEYLKEDVKIWKVVSYNIFKKNYEPGKVLEIIGSDIVVKTYDGAIRILDHDFDKLPIIGEYI